MLSLSPSIIADAIFSLGVAVSFPTAADDAEPGWTEKCSIKLGVLFHIHFR
jgi:hypothetical protein